MANQELNRFANDTKSAWMSDALLIATNPFAKGYDNEQLIDLARASGMQDSEEAEARRLVLTTGFDIHHWNHVPGAPLNEPQEIIDRETSIGAILLRQGQELFGEEIQAVVDTSAYLPPSVNRDIMKKADLNPDKIIGMSYRAACASLIMAWIDLLADERFQNLNVAFLALEPLSELFAPEHLRKAIIPATFEDGHGVMFVKMNRFQLEAAIISIKPDKGVIQIPTMYDFPNRKHDPRLVPSHYSFAQGGQEILRKSDEGTFLGIDKPRDGSSIYMNGARTGVFFGRETPQTVAKLLQQLGNPNLLRELREENTFIHPASKRVGEEMAQNMHELSLIDDDKRPFYLADAGRANSSSNTILEEARHRLRIGLFNPDKHQVWVAPGIGSAVAGLVTSLK